VQRVAGVCGAGCKGRQQQQQQQQQERDELNVLW
jgi:hypothetical protein